MADSDRIKHEGEEFKGKAKEAYGDVTDDEQKQAEGQADQDEAKLKKVGDKVKDAGRDLKDTFKRD
ncbi:CsbD family protein [Phytoactinopolyspora alkaliphila]|uniref:CsbD family protein n=1 Tax=Phytoactinopolyspora alkaliphila TaxID=1783498 RepID=A0A6N9YPK3_9ACTN|nr:CsbD family protein [Phytoactinopolyspora alkaliphila]NED96976.1 CsbD family protein [Phytoactinopolyspora alkaliphila]